MTRIKAAIIGSGNLAFHFLPALSECRFISLICLHSRNEEVGMDLCRENKIAYAKSLRSIPEDVSLFLLMVNDTAIAQVSQELAKIVDKEKIIVHFSGSTSLDVIDSYFKNSGSVWPIQSVAKNDTNLNIKEIPLCISSSSNQVASTLQKIFNTISPKVLRINEDDKKVLHLAAVIANNFTNHLFHLSKTLIENVGFSFDLLKPIITKTAENAVSYNPEEVQTGPAIRGDFDTMKDHLELLEGNENLRTIYELLSKSIN